MPQHIPEALLAAMPPIIADANRGGVRTDHARVRQEPAVGFGADDSRLKRYQGAVVGESRSRAILRRARSRTLSVIAWPESDVPAARNVTEARGARANVENADDLGLALDRDDDLGNEAVKARVGPVAERAQRVGGDPVLRRDGLQGPRQRRIVDLLCLSDRVAHFPSSFPAPSSFVPRSAGRFLSVTDCRGPASANDRSEAPGSAADGRNDPRNDKLLERDQPAQATRPGRCCARRCCAKITPSWPISPTIVTPAAMFCGEIILPVTPPEVLVAASSTGLRPNCEPPPPENCRTGGSPRCRCPSGRPLPSRGRATAGRTVAGRGHPGAQRIGHARVVVQVSQPDDHQDGQIATRC